MAYNPEKTNAKNIEGVHIANTIIASFGAVWNTPNPFITAAALTEFETDFKNLTQAVNVALPAEQNAVGEQIAAFKLVSKRVTKIVKAARAQNLSEEFLGHLTPTADRLRGIRVTNKTPDNPETPEDESKSDNSTSRRSYAGILETLALLIQQLISNSDYQPNENEYKTATLLAWYEDLQAKHYDALAAKNALRIARDARNTLAYNDENGLLPRMQWVKDYAETLDLPAGDTRPKQLRKLPFRNPTA